MIVGVIGLGEMGSGFVERLLLGKYDVIGWNRTKSKAEPLLAKGMTWGTSPREIATRADLVLTIVTNDHALRAIADGEDGWLGAISGKVVVEMSTVSPDCVKALAADVAAAGGVLLDGPVLGSQITLREGKLLIMIGGDQGALARVREPLEAIGPKVFHVGDVGQAKVMKIALNLNIATQIMGLSEGLLLAVKSGIPRDTALDIMLGGALASPMLQYRAPLIKAQPEKGWFDVAMMQKDVELALDLGRDLGVPLPTTSTSNAWLTAARGQGLTKYDCSILYYALARAAGMDLEIPKA